MLLGAQSKMSPALKGGASCCEVLVCFFQQSSRDVERAALVATSDYRLRLTGCSDSLATMTTSMPEAESRIARTV